MTGLGEAEALLAAGRAAEAAAGFAAFLADHPDCWPVWLRQASAMLAAGEPESALLLVAEAARLAPDEPLVAAARATVLQALGRPAEAPPQPPPASLLCDVSDLLEYLAHSRTPTGIQRVQFNILHAMLQAGTGAACAYDALAGEWKPLPPSLFLRLHALSRSGGAADAAWRSAHAAALAALRQAAPCRFAPGATLVNLGSSWWQPGYMRRVKRLKRAHGLRYLPFLYDCIPLLAPQHCDARLCEEFARWFAQLCLLADGVVVISEHTRRDFEALRQRLLPGVGIPVFTLPLDADARLHDEAVAAPAERGRPYVLFVATLESRKNHLLVFQAWQALLQRHGAARVPELVCVGKRGWLAEAALALHAADPALQANVTLLHGIADVELAGLYRGCAFTLFNSFYEGWGLPVTESFSHGKAALVADNTSLPEAGGAAAVYFRTDDLADLLAKLESLIFDATALAAAEARARAVQLRDWPALAGQLAQHVAAAAGVSLPAERRTLRPGEVWDMVALPGPEPRLLPAAAELTREGEAFMQAEPWGCWVRPGRVALRLPLAEMPGAAPLRVLVQIVGPPAPWQLRARAGAGSGIARDFTLLAGHASQVVNIAFEVPAEAWPEVLVEFDAPEPVPLANIAPGDPRVVGFGLCHVMVCGADDYAARLDYLESRATQVRLARI